MSTKTKKNKQEIIEATPTAIVEPTANLDVVFKPSNDLQLDRLNIRQPTSQFAEPSDIGNLFVKKEFVITTAKQEAAVLVGAHKKGWAEQTDWDKHGPGRTVWTEEEAKVLIADVVRWNAEEKEPSDKPRKVIECCEFDLFFPFQEGNSCDDEAFEYDLDDNKWAGGILRTQNFGYKGMWHPVYKQTRGKRVGNDIASKLWTFKLTSGGSYFYPSLSARVKDGQTNASAEAMEWLDDWYKESNWYNEV